MKDLSNLAKGWPAFGASMAGGNGIDNEPPQGKLPGSESEQTDQVSQQTPHSDATPDLSIPAASGSDRHNAKASGYKPGSLDWKKL